MFEAVFDPDCRLYTYIVCILSKLHNEGLSDLYCSPNIVRVIKSRRMRWLGHVTRIVVEETWGNLRKRDHLEDPGVDWRITLRWIFRKWDVGAGTGLI